MSGRAALLVRCPDCGKLVGTLAGAPVCPGCGRAFAAVRGRLGSAAPGLGAAELAEDRLTWTAASPRGGGSSSTSATG